VDLHGSQRGSRVVVKYGFRAATMTTTRPLTSAARQRRCRLAISPWRWRSSPASVGRAARRVLDRQPFMTVPACPCNPSRPIHARALRRGRGRCFPADHDRHLGVASTHSPPAGDLTDDRGSIRLGSPMSPRRQLQQHPAREVAAEAIVTGHVGFGVAVSPTAMRLKRATGFSASRPPCRDQVADLLSVSHTCSSSRPARHHFFELALDDHRDRRPGRTSRSASS